VLPGAEGAAPGGRPRLAFEEPSRPADEAPSRTVFGVGRLALVADEPVRPEVGDADLQAVAFGFDRGRDVDAPGIAPDDAQVAAVEPDGGHDLDPAHIEPEARVSGRRDPGDIEGRPVEGLAGIIPNRRLRPEAPVVEILEDDLVGPAPRRIERDVPGPGQRRDIRGHRKGVFPSDRGFGGLGSSAEDDEERPVRFKAQGDGRAAASLLEFGQGASLPRERVPELGALAGHPKCRRSVDSPRLGVGHEIDLRSGLAAVDPTERDIRREVRRHGHPPEHAHDAGEIPVLRRIVERRRADRPGIEPRRSRAGAGRIRCSGRRQSGRPSPRPGARPDDAAPAEGPLGDLDAVTVAPDLGGQPLDLGVAVRIAGQRGRLPRPRPDDGSARFDEVANLFEKGGRHGLALGKNEDAVAHAVRENDLAVGDGGGREKRLRRAAVESGPGRTGRAAAKGRGRRPERVGRALGHEEADVGDRQSVAEQELAAGEVLVIGRDHVPPGLGPLPMDAVGSHGQAGLDLEPGLVLVAMEDDAVDPGREGPVAEGLHRGRMGPPGLPVVRGKGLRGHHPAAVRVGDAGRLENAVGRIEAVEPEFAHGDVGDRAEGHVGAGRHVVGLDRQAETVAPAELLEAPGVVPEDELVRGLPQVPKEPLRDLQTVDRAAGHDRKIRERVVAAPRPEVFAEGGRPVLGAHLPAVDMDRRPAGDAVGPARPDLADQGADEGVVVGVERGGVELVALEPQSGDGRRTRVGAGRRPAEAQDGPAAGRDVPDEAPIRLEAAGDVDDAGPVDGRPGRERGVFGGRRDERPHARLGGVGRADIKRFLVNVGDRRAGGGRRGGQNGHVPIEPVHLVLDLLGQAALAEEGRAARGPRQDGIKMKRPADLRRGGHDVLHGLLGLDPRAARAGPAGAGVERDLEAEPLRLLDDMLE